MVKIKHRGNFNKTEDFFKRNENRRTYDFLDKYGRAGVDALSSATPINSGLTANSWGYEIHSSQGSVTITWTNSNLNQGIPIAILIQYGHGTGTGGYVQGMDYINPSLRSLFDKMSDEAWKEVTGHGNN